MVELVDTHALGACTARCEGSSPFSPTNKNVKGKDSLKNHLPDELLETCLVDVERYQLASGRLSDQKFDFDLVTQDESPQGKELFQQTTCALGALVLQEFPECDTIVTVAEGANSLCTPVARYISRQNPGRPHVEGRVTGKLRNQEFFVVGGGIYLRRRNIVVVDDVFTEGSNAGKVSGLIQKFGGSILGVAVVLNRNERGVRSLHVPERGELPVHSLIEYPVPTYEPSAAEV